MTNGERSSEELLETNSETGDLNSENHEGHDPHEDHEDHKGLTKPKSGFPSFLKLVLIVSGIMGVACAIIPITIMSIIWSQDVNEAKCVYTVEPSLYSERQSYCYLTYNHFTNEVRCDQTIHESNVKVQCFTIHKDNRYYAYLSKTTAQAEKMGLEGGIVASLIFTIFGGVVLFLFAFTLLFLMGEIWDKRKTRNESKEYEAV